MKHLIPKILLVQYLIAAICYGVQKDWARVLYWIGAFVIVLGTLLMK